MCFLGAYWNPLGCCTVQFGEKAFMSTKNSRIPWSIRASSSRIHVTRWHFQRKAPITSISFRTGKFTWKHKPHHAIWQNNYAGALIQHHPSHKTYQPYAAHCQANWQILDTNSSTQVSHLLIHIRICVLILWRTAVRVQTHHLVGVHGQVKSPSTLY